MTQKNFFISDTKDVISVEWRVDQKFGDINILFAAINGISPQQNIPNYNFIPLSRSEDNSAIYQNTASCIANKIKAHPKTLALCKELIPKGKTISFSQFDYHPIIEAKTSKNAAIITFKSGERAKEANFVENFKLTATFSEATSPAAIEMCKYPYYAQSITPNAYLYPLILSMHIAKQDPDNNLLINKKRDPNKDFYETLTELAYESEF